MNESTSVVRSSCEFLALRSACDDEDVKTCETQNRSQLKQTARHREPVGETKERLTSYKSQFSLISSVQANQFNFDFNRLAFDQRH